MARASRDVLVIRLMEPLRRAIAGVPEQARISSGGGQPSGVTTAADHVAPGQPETGPIEKVEERTPGRGPTMEPPIVGVRHPWQPHPVTQERIPLGSLAARATPLQRIDSSDPSAPSDPSAVAATISTMERPVMPEPLAAASSPQACEAVEPLVHSAQAAPALILAVQDAAPPRPVALTRPEQSSPHGPLQAGPTFNLHIAGSDPAHAERRADVADSGLPSAMHHDLDEVELALTDVIRRVARRHGIEV